MVGLDRVWFSFSLTVRTGGRQKVMTTSMHLRDFGVAKALCGCWTRGHLSWHSMRSQNSNQNSHGPAWPVPERGAASDKRLWWTRLSALFASRLEMTQEILISEAPWLIISIFTLPFARVLSSDRPRSA